MRGRWSVPTYPSDQPRLWKEAERNSQRLRGREGRREKEMSQERRGLEKPEKICIPHVCAQAHLRGYACVCSCTFMHAHACKSTHTHMYLHE